LSLVSAWVGALVCQGQFSRPLSPASRVLGVIDTIGIDRQFSVGGHPCFPIGLEVGADLTAADHAFEGLVGIRGCASLSQGMGIVQVQRDDHSVNR